MSEYAMWVVCGIEGRLLDGADEVGVVREVSVGLESFIEIS